MVNTALRIFILFVSYSYTMEFEPEINWGEKFSKISEKLNKIEESRKNILLECPAKQLNWENYLAEYELYANFFDIHESLEYSKINTIYKHLRDFISNFFQAINEKKTPEMKEFFQKCKNNKNSFFNTVYQVESEGCFEKFTKAIFFSDAHTSTGLPQEFIFGGDITGRHSEIIVDNQEETILKKCLFLEMKQIFLILRFYYCHIESILMNKKSGYFVNIMMSVLGNHDYGSALAEDLWILLAKFLWWYKKLSTHYTISNKSEDWEIFFKAFFNCITTKKPFEHSFKFNQKKEEDLLYLGLPYLKDIFDLIDTNMRSSIPTEIVMQYRKKSKQNEKEVKEINQILVFSHSGGGFLLANPEKLLREDNSKFRQSCISYCMPEGPINRREFNEIKRKIQEIAEKINKKYCKDIAREEISRIKQFYIDLYANRQEANPCSANPYTWCDFFGSETENAKKLKRGRFACNPWHIYFLNEFLDLNYNVDFLEASILRFRGHEHNNRRMQEFCKKILGSPSISPLRICQMQNTAMISILPLFQNRYFGNMLEILTGKEYNENFLLLLRLFMLNFKGVPIESIIEESRLLRLIRYKEPTMHPKEYAESEILKLFFDLLENYFTKRGKIDSENKNEKYERLQKDYHQLNAEYEKNKSAVFQIESLSEYLSKLFSLWSEAEKYFQAEKQGKTSEEEKEEFDTLRKKVKLD